MSEPEHAALDARRRRLLFRATHRGTQENDMLIGGFVKAHIAALTEPDIAAAGSAAGTARHRSGRLADRPPADPARGRYAAAAAHPGRGRPKVHLAPRSGGGRRRSSPAEGPPPQRPMQKHALRMTATPVYGAPEGWDAFLLARRRAEFAGPVLHVTRDDARMARLAEALAFVAPGSRDPALPRLGLPALRPRLAQPGAGLRTHRHPGAPAGKARRAPASC